MMQVSTLYAHSLERQLVSRRSQLLQNISRTCSVDQQQQDHQPQSSSAPVSPTGSPTSSAVDVQLLVDELFLSEAGIIPPELRDDTACPTVVSNNDTANTNINNNSSSCNLNVAVSASVASEIRSGAVEVVDSKEFTDRLCKLPSQCKGGYILGSPRRHSTGMNPSATRLCQSAGQINLSSDMAVVKGQNGSSGGKKCGVVSGSVDNSSKGSATGFAISKKDTKKKGKEKKEAKKLPSNFMYLGTWSTRHNSEKLLEQVKSGDVLEFNIKFHHHWGIALVNKNKKPTLENVELIHLKKDKDGSQRAVKQTLAEYWTEGVTARINNSRDVHKPPLSAADVISTSLKTVAQTYRIWQNSEQLITHCRYGEGGRSRQLSDAARLSFRFSESSAQNRQGEPFKPDRWGTLSKCVGLWLSLTSSSRNNSPATSPALRRKRTCSVNF